MINELKKILDPEVRKKIFQDYAELKEKLNTGGAASKVAVSILNDIKNKSL